MNKVKHTLPDSQSSPELPSSPLQCPSVECEFLQLGVLAQHCQQAFAEVFPYLVKEHLLLVGMIFLGHMYQTVVALSKVHSEGPEPAIIINLLYIRCW